LLSNRGRFAEAEAIADEILATKGDDPWVSGVRAWLAFQQGRSTNALEFLELPLQQDYDLGWYYDLRALCHLAIGEIEAALEDYRSIVAKAVPVDGLGKCQLAIACLVLGDLPGARQWLDRAGRDVMTEPSVYHSTSALVAMAVGDADGAERFVRDAVDATDSLRELQDIGRLFQLLLPVLRTSYEAVGRLEQRLRMTLEHALPDQTRRLAKAGPTADSQLGDAARKHGLDSETPDFGVPAIAVLATQSRRWEQAGALQQATDGYQRLLATAFAPEAKVGLGRALMAANEQHVARGDVDGVMRIQERLRGLGVVDRIEAGLAVAAALEAKGEVDQVRTYLEGLLPEAGDDVQSETIHQRIGELSLFTGDLEVAKEHLDRALVIAEGREDLVRMARIETRRAVVESVRDPTASPWIQALRAWRAAGAFDATRTLVEELKGLLDTPSASRWRQRVLESLRSTLVDSPTNEQFEEFGTIGVAGIYQALEPGVGQGPKPAAQ
jgi:tetratricopeptide (TPR) repeat protein